MDTLDWSFVEIERQTVANTIAVFNSAVDFVAKQDLSIQLALIALVASGVSMIVMGVFLWRTRGNDMGKVRKKMRNRKVADAVCNLIEQLKSENVLTNDEADDYYRRLEKVFKTGELRPRGYYVRFPLVETAKERLINKRLEMDFHKPNIPGDKPAPVKKVKVSRIKKEEVPAVVKEKRKLFSFFTRKPAAV